MSFITNKDLSLQELTEQRRHSHPIFKRISGLIKEYSIPALYLTVLLGLFIFIVSRNLPKVGHDYGYHIPRMLDTHLHHKINGIGVQWYTPSFSAGSPAYPNPQYIQYSLPQFLMFVVNPWLALLLSLVIYSVIGFTSFYLFLRHEMGLISNASALGASFILANGFFVDHAIAGHVGFQHFPLLGLILFLVFSRRLGFLPAGILIGLVSALIVHQSGFYILAIFLLSLFIIFPLIYLLRPELFKMKLFATLLTGAVSTMLLSISKLSAVFAFMRFFPRIVEDEYGRTYFQGIIGLIKQLIGIIAIIPYQIVTGKDAESISQFFRAGTGADYGLWETNMSLSPGLLFLVMLGIISIIFGARKTTLSFSREKTIAVLFLCMAIWLATDLALAQGWLYNLLKPLPLLRSLHVNVRFTSAFIFPLALLGAFIFHQVLKDKKIGNQVTFLLLDISTIAMLCLYLVIPAEVHNRNFNIGSALSTYSQIDNGQNFSINTIAEITDMETFSSESSNMSSQDAIFGYELEYFRPKVTPGPILEIQDGYYNITNPASYVFPEENNLQPFEPFRQDQKKDLELFLNHKQPNLKISGWQRFANIVNLVALVIASLYLLFRMLKGSVRSWQTIAR